MSIISIPTIYERLPVPLQNAAVTLAGLALSHLRSGHRSAKIRQEIDALMRLSAGEIRDWQLSRIKTIVSYAYENVRFYRRRFDEIGFLPGDLRTWEDFLHLPLTTKAHLQQHADEMVSTAAPAYSSFVVQTSGTTGKPRLIRTSASAIAAHHAHFTSVWKRRNITSTARWVRIGGSRVIPRTQKCPPFWRYNYFDNQLYMSARHISLTSADAYQKAICDFSPAVINGYSSALYGLALCFLKLGLAVPRTLGLVLCDSESLLPLQKDAIHQAFHCEVASYYGLAEKVAFLSECVHGLFHVHPSYGVVEFLSNKGKSAASGIAAIVGTTLINNAMPLIRYVTEDVAYLDPSQKSCACPLSSPVITRIDGRMGDLICTPSGIVLAPAMMEHCMDNVYNAKKVYVEQQGITELIVHFYPDEGFSDVEVDAFVKKARELTNQEINIKTTIHSDSPPDSLKYRFIRSDISPRALWGGVAGTTTPGDDQMPVVFGQPKRLGHY